MNKVELLKFYEQQHKIHSDRWNETSDERDLNEALGYQQGIDQLISQAGELCNQDCAKFGDCIHRYLKRKKETI